MLVANKKTISPSHPSKLNFAHVLTILRMMLPKTLKCDFLTFFQVSKNAFELFSG